LILLGIIGFSFSITAQYFAARSAVYTGKSMRSDLFAHMNQFSYQEIDQVGTSTLINRMSNDINQVQNGVNMFLRLFLRSPFVVFGAMFMAFTAFYFFMFAFQFEHSIVMIKTPTAKNDHIPLRRINEDFLFILNIPKLFRNFGM
jgi:ABC-type multidrug transport system fused ATPase/permease subunit